MIELRYPVMGDLAIAPFKSKSMKYNEMVGYNYEEIMLWKKVKLDEWIRVWLQSQIYDYRWIQVDKNDVALYVYVGSEPTFLCFELKYVEQYRDVHVSLIKYNDENALQNELANMWYTNFNRKSPLHFLSAKHSISFDVFRVVADSCTNGKLDIPKGYEDLEDYVFTMME